MKLEGLVRGLDTLADALVGDTSYSPDLANVRVDTGLLRQRKGYRMLDREPSNIDSGGSNKGRVALSFDEASGEYGDTGANFAHTFGTKFTIRLEMAFAQSGNVVAGSRDLLYIYAGGTIFVDLYAEGDGAGIRLGLSMTDVSGGTTVTLLTAYKTVATWTANANSRFIRIERSGSAVTLYVGETAEATSSSFSALQMGTTAALQINQGPNGTANSVFYGLTILNRLLTEEETYWGPNFPTDPYYEDQQILGNWPAIEATGTTLKDYSGYAQNITLISTPTWSGGANRFGRGLGIHCYRRRDGTKYHVVAASRTGTSSSSASPTGAVYVWLADKEFFPFYFGGSLSANDGTASLDGLSLLHRICFLTFKDILYLCNGSDSMRQYYSSWGYLGGTAPHVKPVVGVAAGTNQWKYVQTWYNSTTKKETGASPVAEAANATVATTVQTWLSSDSQFNKARVYRTSNGGTVFYLVGEVNAGASLTDNLTDADAQKQPLLAGPDGSSSGNALVKRSYIPGGPATAPTLAVGAGGNVNAGNHYYCYSWYNSTTLAETGMSPLSAVVAPGVASIINLSAIRSPNSSTDYDQVRVWRTKAGAFQWFLVAAFTPAGYSTTNEVYADNTADSGITTTLETKALPPKCAFMVNFASRVFYGGDPSAKGTGWWSAAGDGEAVTWTAGHDPNPGAELVAFHATKTNLYWHYSDGRIFVMDAPGPDAALEQFVPFNLREWSPRGAAVGNATIQDTPLGTIWLGADGFYRALADGVENISPTITPSFLSLNRQRGKYACSLYDEQRQLYRCWLSRGNKRYNEECFVLDLKNLVWLLDDDPWADAAGVLYDGQEVPHYCVLEENGCLAEIREDVDNDGGGSGTLSGAVSGATMVSFTDIGARGAPAGEDSGYPVWFVKSDGTIYKRRILAAGLGIVAGKINFYPSLKELESGSWTVYFNAIRGRWKSMQLDFGDRRYDRSLGDFILYHGEESAATSLTISAAAAEGSVASIGTVTLNNGDNRGIIEKVPLNGRVFQVLIDHNPPVASRTFRITGFEFGTKLDGDTDS